MTIRAVAFDYGGVLARFIDPATVRLIARTAGSEAHNAPDSIDTTVEALWKNRAGYDSGDLEAEEYWTGVIHAAGTEHATPQLIRLLMELDTAGWSHMYAEMIRWAAALQEAGYVTLIISNMAVATYDMILRDAVWRNRFDHVILSGSLRINKPDRRIFEAALETTGIAAEEMLFLDDLAPNVAGASEVGLQAFQFVNPAVLLETLQQKNIALPVTGLETH
jgi:putative hydrolase of the HAD superfamily